MRSLDNTSGEPIHQLLLKIRSALAVRCFVVARCIVSVQGKILGFPQKARARTDRGKARALQLNLTSDGKIAG